MRTVCISDEDTVNLFRLMGIEGIILESEDPEQFKEKMETIIKDPQVGLVIISERYLIRQQNYIERLKTQKYPIVIEVPDFSNPIPENYYEEALKKNLSIG